MSRESSPKPRSRRAAIARSKGLAPCGGDAAVEHLAVERVAERVLRAAAAVGPVRRLQLLHEAPGAGEGGAVVLDVGGVAGERGSERLAGERGTDDARRLEEKQERRRLSVQPRVDHRARALGHGGLEAARVDGAPPDAVGVGQPAALLQVLDGVQQEERVAVGLPMQALRDLGGKGMARVARREIVGDRVGLEPVEGDLDALPPRGQLVLQLRDRMPLRHRVDRAIGAEDEQRRRLAPHRDARQRGDRRRVAPMQILEDEHEQAVGRERLQHPLQLARHARSGRRGERTLQLVVLGRRQQPGQLEQPGRGLAAQHVEDGVRLVHELLQRFEQRHVRLACTVGVDALAARHERALRGRRGEEVVDERRLADARLAHDEDHLPLAAGGARGGVREGAEGRVAADERGHALAVVERGGVRELADPAIPAAVDRLDEARRARVVVQRVAHLAHRHAQHRVDDVGVGPHRFEERVLRDELIRPRDEVLEDAERVDGQLHTLVAVPETLVLPVEARSRGRGRHRTPAP
jgi:hypothetical protein